MNAEVCQTTCNELSDDFLDCSDSITLAGCACPPGQYVLDNACVPQNRCTCVNKYEPEGSNIYTTGSVIARKCSNWYVENFLHLSCNQMHGIAHICHTSRIVRDSPGFRYFVPVSRKSWNCLGNLKNKVNGFFKANWTWRVCYKQFP